ncbi:SsgA family sporulation/cell division regulator [Streptomyces sp. NPDC059916]|uniref:SsgA family sporulation/cell division regulator n=1 Tax=Streptomyces sp. NPDC059916 TaxID=3347001 RepID=UPI0036C343E5
MSVEKDITMDNADVTEDEFDALLSTSSLGAPHVLAETELIPAEIGHRLAQAAAAHPQPQDYDAPEQKAVHPAQAKRAMLVSVDIEAYAAERPAGHAESEAPTRGIVWAAVGSGKTAAFATLIAHLAQTRQAFCVSQEELASSRVRRQDLMRVLLAMGFGAHVPRSIDAVLATCRRVEQRRRAAENAARRVNCLVRDTRLDPAHRTGESQVPSWSGRPLHTARMTELLASAREPAGSASRHLAIHVAVRASAAWAWAQRTADELHAAPQPVLFGNAGSGAQLPTSAQLHQYMGQMTQQTRPFGMPPIAGPATSVRPHLTCPAWPQRLLIASHLPVLWAPACTRLPFASGVAPSWQTPDESADVPQRLPNGSTHHRDVPTSVWSEDAEKGPALHTRLQMTLHDEEGDAGEPAPAQLTYRLSDPYAVEATFHPDGDEAVVWAFARDLLTEGLDHSAGEGDVIVWTVVASDPDQEQRTYIRLNSPGGTALLSAPHRHLKRYLERTQHLCTPGMEHLHVGAALDTLEGELGELTCRGLGD